MALGIYNAHTNTVIQGCGHPCDQTCDLEGILHCAKRFTITKQETHSVVELCHHCLTSQATFVRYVKGKTWNVCGACFRLPDTSYLYH